MISNIFAYQINTVEIISKESINIINRNIISIDKNSD